MNNGDGIFTTRQLLVWQMTAEGMTDNAIGLTLGVSRKTVQDHRWRVCRKLKVRGIACLTRAAIRYGLIVA